MSADLDAAFAAIVAASLADLDRPPLVILASTTAHIASTFAPKGTR